MELVLITTERSERVTFNPFLPTVAFNICCPSDCVSRHNGGTAGAPLKPLRDDSALRALSSPRGSQSLGQQMLNATVGKNVSLPGVFPRSTLYRIRTGNHPRGWRFLGDNGERIQPPSSLKLLGTIFCFLMHRRFEGAPKLRSYDAERRQFRGRISTGR